MQTIVKRRQYRKLVETNKRDLGFRVKGRKVPEERIDAWMKRYKVPQDEPFHVEGSSGELALASHFVLGAHAVCKQKA